MEAIRVLIVDDQHLIRDGIASLLLLQSGIEVTGTAANGQEALEAVQEQSPDVILMDIRMPVMDGIAAVEELRRRGSKAKVLMLTTFDDEEYIMKSLRAGAYGYLMKDLPIEDLTRAIVQVYAGTYQLAPGVMDSLLKNMNGAEGASVGATAGLLGVGGRAAEDGFVELDPGIQRIWESFSSREQDVLRFLGRGATNNEIAEAVNLSPGTVKNYVSGILTAFDLRDRTQAALLAVKYGWDR